jgi:inorganic pyrophosphatase
VDAGLVLADWAARTIEAVMDRPLGSAHPKFPALVYELNYGYVPGTVAPDGDPIDVYVLGAGRPLERCTGEVIAAIRRRDDVEDKLVVALSGAWDEASIKAATQFQERFFDSWVEMPRPE